MALSGEDTYHERSHKIMTRTEVDGMKKRFPSGTRIRLISLDDPYRELPEGSMGTVDEVDDAGTVHVKWDAGFQLGLVSGTDQFEAVSK